MKGNPALTAAFLMCGGTCAGRFIHLPWWIWGACAAVLFILSLVQLIRGHALGARDSLPSVSFSLLLFLSTAAACSARVEVTRPSHILHLLDTSKPLALLCEVADEPRAKDGRTVSLVHVRSALFAGDTLDLEGDAILTIALDKRAGEQPREYTYGSVIEFESTLNAPIAQRNPGEFSYRDYLALNGIYATVRVVGYHNVRLVSAGNPNWFFARIIFPSKHFVQRVINSSMSGNEADFLTGLLLGDRTDMSAEIKNAFINTGTIHVLAVSGSHVVLVVAIIYTLFGLIRLPERAKIVATIVSILYYMELTGATASVVRASLMAIVVLCARLFQERSTVYNSLGASAVILLLVDPFQLFDAGCQLSYSAVFSMVYFYPKLAGLIKMIPESLEEIKAIDFVLKLFALSLSAQIGTIPFTAYFFGRVSLISLLANLVVVPLVEIIVTVGFVAVLAGICSFWLAGCFCEVNNLLTWFTLRFVLLANAVPYAVIPTPLFGFTESFFYSVAVAALFNLTHVQALRKVVIVGLAGVDIVLCATLFVTNDRALRPLRINFLDVGQGDAALIECPSGENLLVDAGPLTVSSDAGEKIIAPFLLRRGIHTLDALIVSHPHSDHLGGVPYVLRNFEVKEVIDQSQRDQTRLYYDYDLLVSKIRHVVTAGNLLKSLNMVRLYVLHPVLSFLDVDSTDGYSHLNNVSVVLKLVYGSTSFLFVGDAEVPVEEQLERVYGSFLKSDLLKAGHHGSSTSSSEEFIAAVHPEEVVVSVGKFNKFHHPSQKVLKRFARFGVRIHRTDEEGAVIFESDGRTIKHVNWRKD